MSMNFGYSKTMQYLGVLVLTSLLLNQAQALGIALYNPNQETFTPSSISINPEEVAQSLMYTNSFTKINLEDIISRSESSGGLSINFQSIGSSFGQIKFNGSGSNNPMEIKILATTAPSEIFKDVYYSDLIGKPQNTEPTLQNVSANTKAVDLNSVNVTTKPTNNRGNSLGLVLTQLRQFGNLNIREISSPPRYATPLASLSNFNAGIPSYNFGNKKPNNYTRNNLLGSIQMTRSAKIIQETSRDANTEIDRRIKEQNSKFRQIRQEEAQKERRRQQEILQAQKSRESDVKRMLIQTQ